MILRFVVLFALASTLLVAKQQHPLPDCCEPEFEKLSQLQVKALVHKTQPIHAPCCADMLHISGTVVLAISVDPKGEVTRVQMVSGHPLIIGQVIPSSLELPLILIPPEGGSFGHTLPRELRKVSAVKLRCAFRPASGV